MSFYSYKNGNSDASPGNVCGNILNGLNKKVCIQVKNVYDACLQQEQLDDRQVVISNVVPVLASSCQTSTRANCNCACDENVCTCSCNDCGNPISHAEAVENAANSPCPLPQPVGAWTFESCRSSTIRGNISNLSIERMCDRPQFARVRCNVDVPIDILFTDQRCQEWMGQSTLTVAKDVLLCIPEESVIPFTIESLVSAICVSGTYIGNCTFEITICVSVVLNVPALCLQKWRREDAYAQLHSYFCGRHVGRSRAAPCPWIQYGPRRHSQDAQRTISGLQGQGYTRMAQHSRGGCRPPGRSGPPQA